MCTVLYPNRVLDSPAGRLQWPSVETMTWSGVIGITDWDCSPKSVAAFCRFRRERLAVKPVWLLFISYLLQSFDCILWTVGIWSPNGHCLSPSNGEMVLRIWLTRFSLSSGWTSLNWLCHSQVSNGEKVGESWPQPGIISHGHRALTTAVGSWLSSYCKEDHHLQIWGQRPQLESVGLLILSGGKS